MSLNTKLKVGSIYRFPYRGDYSEETQFGYTNFYKIIKDAGFYFRALPRGIHYFDPIQLKDGSMRNPVIIIMSSPRKAGSKETPWKDIFDSEGGFVIYYGDYKNESKYPSPEQTIGNRFLLSQQDIYLSKKVDSDLRLKAIPIIFFERVSIPEATKGNAIFHGLGVIEKIERVTQCDSTKQYFSNYRYRFAILSLAEENEEFDWRWITDRSNPDKTDKDTLRFAPVSWKRWIKEGNACLPFIRRNILGGRNFISTAEQVPTSKQTEILNEILNYYEDKKSEFEFLALDISLWIMKKSGIKCKPGWITQRSSDGGYDFVFRIDIGDGGLATTNIIVLGQAKCTQINKTVNGTDIARLVSRLKRGWIGTFVSTSRFSENVQKEIIEDNYPIMMVNGKKIAEYIEEQQFEYKKSVKEILNSLHYKYERLYKSPEEILID